MIRFCRITSRSRNDWKVHHVSTDMVNQAWMQAEEEAFLNDPAAVFNSGHYQALRAIQQRIGLEYFGIDCGLDRSGNLVVFEVNASMLVHERNEDFPYKAPFVRSHQDGIRCDAAETRERRVKERVNRSAALLRRRILRQQRDRLLHGGHELRGEDDGGVLLDRDLRHRLQGAQLQRHRDAA